MHEVDTGIRRAIGVLAAAQRSYSGCAQYRENVRDARATLAPAGLADVDVVYAGDWYEHPGFVEANADHVRAAVTAARTHKIALAGADYHGPGLNDLCTDTDRILDEVRAWS